MRYILYLILFSFLMFQSKCSLWQESFTGESGTWLILVYLDGDNNLESSAIQDLNEMEMGFETDQDFNVLVLFDRAEGYSTADGDWTGTRLYWVQSDSDVNAINSKRLSSPDLGLTDKFDREELNLGDPQILKNFIEFGKKNFPSDYTALVLWNHGDGWKTYSSSPYKVSPAMYPLAICEDDSSGDVLDNWEIRQALSGQNINILGMDACSMGSLEVAYELKESARFLIASPDTEPVSGWDYDGFLQTFGDSALMPQNFYQAVVDSYAEDYQDQARFTLSVFDLSKIGPVITAFNDYSSILMEVTNQWWTNFFEHKTNLSTIQHLLLSSVEYYSKPNERDLYDLVTAIPNDYTIAVQQALDNFIVYKWLGSGGDIKTGNPDGHGLSIYYATSQDEDFSEYLAGNVSFIYDGNNWSEYLEAVRSFPPFDIAGYGTYEGILDYQEHELIQIYVNEPGTLELTLDVPTHGDDDLYLYFNGQLQKASTQQYDSDETLLLNVDQTGWYTVRIYRYTPSDMNYQLSISGTAGILK